MGVGMKRAEAKFLVVALTKILTGRNIVEIAVGPDDRVDVRPNTVFECAKMHARHDGLFDVSLTTAGWFLPGATCWRILADSRTVRADGENGFGKPLVWCWTVVDDASGDLWRVMQCLANKHQRVRRV